MKETIEEYLHCTRTACYFYGSFTRNRLAFTPSQNAPEGEQPLGYKTCVNSHMCGCQKKSNNNMAGNYIFHDGNESPNRMQLGRHFCLT